MQVTKQQQKSTLTNASGVTNLPTLSLKDYLPFNLSVLSEDGWIRLDECFLGDKVLTFNSNLRPEFNKINSISKLNKKRDSVLIQTEWPTLCGHPNTEILIEFDGQILASKLGDLVSSDRIWTLSDRIPVTKQNGKRKLIRGKNIHSKSTGNYGYTSKRMDKV